ncbi:nucleotide pyrophosphohydrolase [Chryseobacterium ginsengisoli]|uniref:Nucleotide pyrophosphohydrolase n=1 Tax=Chryseobacterium ginsengisoli TaxID=363853 RepID=A0ABP9MZI2_9FLAO
MKEIIQQILKFRDDRNWKQFHTDMNLLIGLNIEVGELQEHFLWNNDFNKDKKGVKNEIADIFIFLIYLCDKYDIDLEEAVINKLKIHSQHYPVEEYKNKSIKYNQK